MTIYKLLVSIYLILVCNTLLYSQKVEYKYFNTENGLENSELSCITQHKSGVLFIGTINGLISYNGSRFAKYMEPDSLNGNYVLSIANNESQIVFSTMNGLYSFDGTTYTELDRRSKIYSVTINRQENAAYYSIKDSVFKILLSNQKKNRTFICCLNNNEAIIKHITILKNNSIYLSTGKGLYHFGPSGQVSCLSPNPSFYTYVDTNQILNNVTHFNIERYKLNNESLEPIQYRDKFPESFNVNPSVMKVFASHHNEVLYLYAPLLSHNYIENDNQETKSALKQSTHLYKINIEDNTPEIELLDLPESLTSPSSIFADRTGQLWITTLDGLFHMAIPEKRYNYNYIPTKHSVANISALESKVMFSDQSLKGYILQNGYQIDSTTLDPLFSKLRNNLSGSVYSTQIDKNGNILVATLKKGIAIKTFSGECKYLIDSSKSSIIAMTKDEHGNVYAGGTNGIFIWDGTNLKKLLHHKIIDESFIFDLYYRNNTLFIASSSGLFTYNSGGIENISEMAGLTNVTFSSLCLDHKQRLIAGTYDKGILIFEKSKHTYKLVNAISKNDGLSSNSINSIIIDKSKRLWISTSKNIDIAIEGKSTYIIKSFESNSIYKLNNWSEQKLFIDSNNVIYIGGKKGLIYFKSSDYTLDSTITNSTVIQAIKVNNLPLKYINTNLNPSLIGPPQDLVFNPNQNNISFEFTAVDYNHENIRYQFYLEGLEDVWNVPTEEKSINYRNLPPGNYIFKVRHGYNGIWSDTESLAFSIKFPWWRTWVFYICCIIFTFILLYYLYQIQIRKIKNKHQLTIKETESKLKILSLQASALLNQMKPHFIFNSLAPLQNFIYKDDKDNALKYLNTF